jgi:hypothetical protein
MDYLVALTVMSSRALTFKLPGSLGFFRGARRIGVADAKCLTGISPFASVVLTALCCLTRRSMIVEYSIWWISNCQGKKALLCGVPL